MPNPSYFRLKIECDDAATYVDEAGNRYAGALLRHVGLPVPPADRDFASRVIHLKKA